MGRYITDDLKSSSDDFDESDKERIKIKYHDGVFFWKKVNLCVQNDFLKQKR